MPVLLAPRVCLSPLFPGFRFVRWSGIMTEWAGRLWWFVMRSAEVSARAGSGRN